MIEAFILGILAGALFVILWSNIEKLTYRQTLLLKAGENPTAEKLPDGKFYYIVAEDEYVRMVNRDLLEVQQRPQRIMKMINRFLTWHLPPGFDPDCYVSFDRVKALTNSGWPMGTNLLNASQARAMIEHMLVEEPEV